MIDFQLTNPENADLCDPSKSQWYLDPALAERIAVWAQGNFPYPKRMRVLEPSAGRGALAMPLRALFGDVVCCEIDPKNEEYLCRLGFHTWLGDFTQMPVGDDSFDLVVANPPFEGGQTEQHIMHALKFAPRVVCHCPLTTLAGQDRRTGLWSQAYLKRLVIHSSRPKYSGSKEGGKTDMCTIDVVRRPELHPIDVSASGVSVGWWT
jgi:hypothetical protein